MMHHRAAQADVLFSIRINVRRRARFAASCLHFLTSTVICELWRGFPAYTVIVDAVSIDESVATLRFRHRATGFRFMAGYGVPNPLYSEAPIKYFLRGIIKKVR